MNGVQIQRINQDGHSSCQNCGQHNNHATEPGTLATHFLAEYYRNTSNIGWNAVQYLFDQNCTVICKDRNVGNAHDLLNALSTEYIKRANYGDIRTKWVVINNNSMLINVFGHIQFVGFTGSLSNVHSFSETFILTSTNGAIRCTHHMFDFH